MEISFDPAKRQWTLENRGLDFADAAMVFADDFVELLDDRKDYGEVRYRPFSLPCCDYLDPARTFQTHYFDEVCT